MMKTALLLAIFCVVAFVAHADDPVFPENSVCSIKGTATYTYVDGMDGNKEYKGKGTMKRVNTVALYQFETAVVEARKSSLMFVYLVRPDVGGCGKNYMYCGYKDNGYFSNVDGAQYYKYSAYKYDSSFKPISGLEDYNTFFASKTESVDHAMLFSKKNDKLIAEWFRVGSLKTTISIVYDDVEFFPHYNVDDAFDLQVKNHSNYLTNPELAVTSKCTQTIFSEEENAGFTTSAPWLLIMLVISVLSYVLF